MTTRIDTIAARLEAATPGPWEAGEDENGFPLVRTPDDLRHEVDFMLNDRARGDADADLIAHARTDIPDLLAVVRQVAALHVHDGLGWCDGCDKLWPCTTATALAPLTKEETDGR